MDPTKHATNRPIETGDVVTLGVENELDRTGEFIVDQIDDIGVTVHGLSYSTKGVTLIPWHRVAYIGRATA